MSESDPTGLMELLVAHTDAWNRHDLDGLMQLFTDDCVFEAAGGNEACGTTYAGLEAVRDSFADILSALPDAHFGDGGHGLLSDDRGVSEWTLSGTLADGSKVEINGCDFITVRDGKIALKNSFTKDRPPITG